MRGIRNDRANGVFHQPFYWRLYNKNYRYINFITIFQK